MRRSRAATDQPQTPEALTPSQAYAAVQILLQTDRALAEAVHFNFNAFCVHEKRIEELERAIAALLRSEKVGG